MNSKYRNFLTGYFIPFKSTIIKDSAFAGVADISGFFYIFVKSKTFAQEDRNDPRRAGDRLAILIEFL